MAKGTTFQNALLQLLFQNANIANLGDATGVRGSAAAGALYWSLHTADPSAGTQSTSEIGYTSYARTSKNRASGAGGFTITGNSVSPTDTVSFPAGTGGSGTASHFGLGVASAGASLLLYAGTVTPNIVTGNGVTPQLTTASAITES